MIKYARNTLGNCSNTSLKKDGPVPSVVPEGAEDQLRDEDGVVLEDGKLHIGSRGFEHVRNGE